MVKAPAEAPSPPAPVGGEPTKAHSAAAKRKTAALAAKEPKPRKWSLGKEIAYIIFGCLGSILCIIIFLSGAGFLAGSRYLESIINDIGATNFTKQMERIDHYDSFFDALRTSGYKVLRENPEIDQGVIYYLWQATPPGSDESRVFRWQHDLASKAVKPLNNPALLLDIKLGYVTEQEASQWSFKDPGQVYDPGDALVQAMVNNDFSLINPADLADKNDADNVLPEGPVGAPVLSPSAATHRQENAEEKEDGKADDGQDGSSSDPREAQSVDPGASQNPKPEPGSSNDDPPADPGGNGGGNEPGTGESTEVN